MPLADNGSGVAAEGTVTFTGTVTASGTFNLYIGGRRVQVGVTAGDSVTTIAAALVAAVTADPTLPVTAANTAGVVTLTAKNAGVNGNGIDIRANYYGAPGGETTPAGLTATIVAMATGATNPVLTTGLAALSDEQYDFIAFPYTDTTSLNAIKAELADRWDWDRAIMGHAFAAKVDTVGNLTTFGNGRNDENTSVVGIYNTPTPAEEIAAAVTAQVGLAASNHPARPFGTLPLVGVKAPPKPDLFTTSERDTLYYDGISCTLTQDDGTVRLDRLITTYQQNAFSVPDASYLDYNTRAQLAYIRMTYMYKFGLKFQAGRFILVGDNVKNPNNYQIRPKDIKAEAVAIYGLLIDHGVCENM
ncbi:MAG: phage tail sheath subtilisin-like domain-containing protein, partial [Cyanobacteria bacterium HKST-UBA05]|nr:phage tail sheath subtilisin-like domain-containing protein [Cyanobacteria bacterium HKST-UBA05]